MAEDFIGRLRMANMFGGTPAGKPDLNAGPTFNVNSAIREAVGLQENRRLLDQLTAYGDRDINAPQRIQQIGAGLLNQQQQPQMNQRFVDNSITPFQRESLALEREKLQQRNQTGSQDIALKTRKQELAEKIAGGRATDEEKHEFRMAEIQERGDITSGQIDQRGNITSRQIGERTAGQKEIQNIRGEQNKELQGVKGEQNLANIAARTAGQKEVRQTPTPSAFASKNKPELPTQTRARLQNVITNIRLTRPDLAKFIIEDADGNVMVDPNAGDAALEINRMISGSRTGDIQLPPSGKSKSPVENLETGDPLGIR